MLSDRAATVLNLLVNEYVNTATPVASEEIARNPALQVSSATVRSTMSQLTDEGYISRPHISAGGIPSDLGYRHYVESIPQSVTLPARLRQEIDRYLAEAEPDISGWSQHCAAILSRLTANMAIVTAPRANSPRLKHIQLVFLQDFTALLVVVLGEARLLKRLMPLEQPVRQSQLDRSAEKLNEYLAGLNRAEIQSQQMELNSLEERVKQDSMTLMLEAEQAISPEHHTEGLSRLLNQPEFAEGERARKLVQMVEDRVLLERVVLGSAEGDELSVHIGSENQEEALHHFGVIICQYGIPGQLGGTICVVGPTRMGYGQAIGGVRHLAAFMNQMVQGLQGSATGRSPA